MINENLNINKINEYIEKRKVDWTRHCLNRMQQRNIQILDIKKAISTGKIIEYYEDDCPYPSCLILGYNMNNQMIHIVCGISNEKVHMITAYYPDDVKWDKNKEIRRKI